MLSQREFEKAVGAVMLFVAGGLFVLIFLGTSPILDAAMMIIHIVCAYILLRDKL